MEAKMVANQREQKVCQEANDTCLEKMWSYLEVTEACLEQGKVNTDADQKEIKACWEEVGTCLKKKAANSKEVETVTKHCVVPNE
jgi:hypothetical protein